MRYSKEVIDTVNEVLRSLEESPLSSDGMCFALLLSLASLATVKCVQEGLLEEGTTLEDVDLEEIQKIQLRSPTFAPSILLTIASILEATSWNQETTSTSLDVDDKETQ
jgi:hypothetical protein